MGKVGDAFDVARFAESFFCVSMSLLRNGFELSFFFFGFCSMELRQLESSKVDMVLVSDFIRTLFFLCFL